MSTEQTAFAKRLAAALEAVGVNASPKLLEGLLARYGGTPVTPQAISGWLNGKHLPKQANMRALARIVNKQPYELQYGSKAVLGVSEPMLVWPASASLADRVAMEDYLRLPPRHRKIVRNLIDSLSSEKQENAE